MPGKPAHEIDPGPLLETVKMHRTRDKANAIVNRTDIEVWRDFGFELVDPADEVPKPARRDGRVSDG